DTDTIGANGQPPFCGALHGIDAIDKQLKKQLDDVNQLDFTQYSKAFMALRTAREKAYENR
ncbi:hydrolase, partial [Providencia rettgeri]